MPALRHGSSPAREERRGQDQRRRGMKHTWYVTFEVPTDGTVLRRRHPRLTKTLETEAAAKDFARTKFNDGLIVSAGTIIAPRRECRSRQWMFQLGLKRAARLIQINNWSLDVSDMLRGPKTGALKWMKVRSQGGSAVEMYSLSLDVLLLRL